MHGGGILYFCKRNHKNLHYANKFPNQTIVPRSNEGELGIGDPALRRILRLYVPYGILNRGGAIAGLAVLLLIFVYLPINFGLLRTFLAFARDKRPLTIEGLFCAFNNTYYWKAIGTGLLSGIYTFLWTLLLIVPGIIKGLSYAMALYIVSDNPEIGCDEAIERSMAMMRGHKMRLFLMQLGMIGWSLLSLLTLGIAMLWIVPYYQTVFANFYLEIKAEYEAAGNAA